jgi:hypothetical protein
VFSAGASKICVSVWKNGPESAASMTGGALKLKSPIAAGGDWLWKPLSPPSLGTPARAALRANSTFVKKFEFAGGVCELAPALP